MMTSKRFIGSWCAVGCAALLISSATVAPGREGEEPARVAKTREFTFVYGGTVVRQQPGTRVKLWLPFPPTNADQKVLKYSIHVDNMRRLETDREEKYGGYMTYLEGLADDEGRVGFRATYQVLRSEVLADRGNEKVADEEAKLFLQPDAKVPVDGKPLTLLAGKKLPADQMAVAKLLYDLVNDHMRYSKQGTGWGQGDSAWACDSQFGNCTDFHSLFISLARSQKIPAKFEMGFPLPDQRGSGEIAGYHCWAKFRPAGRGWIPVDISEANKVKAEKPDVVSYYFGNLTENRIVFSVGRDLTLVPPQNGPPLNYFIYPYAEVDGKPVPSDQIERKFEFRDVEKE